MEKTKNTQYSIVPNPNWQRGGLWQLLADGKQIMVNDDKEVLKTYLTLLCMEACASK